MFHHLSGKVSRRLWKPRAGPARRLPGTLVNTAPSWPQRHLPLRAGKARPRRTTLLLGKTRAEEVFLSLFSRVFRYPLPPRPFPFPLPPCASSTFFQLLGMAWSDQARIAVGQFVCLFVVEGYLYPHGIASLGRALVCTFCSGANFDTNHQYFLSS